MEEIVATASVLSALAAWLTYFEMKKRKAKEITDISSDSDQED